MADLENEGFLIEDGLVQRWQEREFGVLEGRLRCKHGLFIDGPTARPIFRYDNSDTKDGHPDAHHKHRFNPTTWREIEPPLWIGEKAWPHLSEVVEELREWWETEGKHLGI